MTLEEIKILFNKYKIKTEKISGLDLSKIFLVQGNPEHFPKLRNFAYTTIEKTPKVYIAPKLKKIPKTNVKAILLHELAHVVYIIRKQKHTERQTDNLAKKIGGKNLYYDIHDIQTLTKTIKKQRPKYLK